MKKPKQIFCEVFGINFFVSIGVSASEYVKQVEKRLNCEIDEPEPVIVGQVNTFKSNDFGYAIWIWTQKWYLPTIMHEIFHAVSSAMRVKNVIHSESSEEAFAYLQGYLVRKIFFNKGVVKKLL